MLSILLLWSEVWGVKCLVYVCVIVRVIEVLNLLVSIRQSSVWCSDQCGHDKRMNMRKDMVQWSVWLWICGKLNPYFNPCLRVHPYILTIVHAREDAIFIQVSSNWIVFLFMIRRGSIEKKTSCFVAVGKLSWLWYFVAEYSGMSKSRGSRSEIFA